MRQDREGLYLIVGTILGVMVLAYGFSGERSFEEAALGTLTAVHEAHAPDGTRIHTQRIDSADAAIMLVHGVDWSPSILILGNSQTHSINQKTNGQTVYPELLQQSLGDSTAVLTHSMPNANMQEFAVAHAWWTSKRDWNLIVVPAFLDDMREDGIRGDFLKAPVAEAFQLTGDGPLTSDLNQQLDLLSNPPSEAGSESEEETPQDIVERELNGWLSEHTDTWKNRSNARGDLFLTLYGLRNKAFGITASTTRKMIPSRYDRNIQAMQELLMRAGEGNQRVLLYIPPIRTDVPPPYDPDEYARFKTAVEEMARQYPHVDFANFESIVPGEFWGLKASTTGDGEPELDFMHFQFAGHQLLAEALEKEIRTP